MKVEFLNENEYRIFIIKEYMKYNNNSEEFLSDIFDLLNLYYDIDNTGYIKVNMYVDPNYGVIIECLANEEKYYTQKLNIELTEIKTDVYIKTDLKKGKKINNKNYIIPTKLSDYELGDISYNI